MSNFLIYHHLGLGDHLICNGLVREICKDNSKKFFIPAKKSNFDTIKFMYRDVVNLNVVSVDGDGCINRLSHQTNSEIITIGHQFLNFHKRFDQSFYDQLNINFDKRWSSFFVQRDPYREGVFYNKNILEEDFIFVHDDAERQMRIDPKYLNHKNIIKADRKKTDIIFDYLKILENAKEIHCIESSFLFLIDSFNFNGKLFSHRYCRKYPENNTPTLKNEWLIL